MSTHISVYGTSFMNVTGTGSANVFPYVPPETYKLYAWGVSGDLGTSPYNYTDVDVSSGLDSIYFNEGAFIAIKPDGSVVGWGVSSFGANPLSPPNNSTQFPGQTIVEIKATRRAFVSRTSSGKVIAWGTNTYGGHIQDPAYTGGSLDLTQSQYLGSNVAKIITGRSTAIGIKNDDTAYVWGELIDNSAAVSSNDSFTPGFPIANVSDAKISYGSGGVGGAVLIVRTDGTVVCWGVANDGGNFTVRNTTFYPTEADLKTAIGTNVVSAYSCRDGGVAVLKSDGSVVTWGLQRINNSTILAAVDGTIPVTEIYQSASAMIAIRNDGSAVTWGDNNYAGGSGGQIISATPGVNKAYSMRGGFVLLMNDGTLFFTGTIAAFGANPADGTYGIDGTYNGGGGTDMSSELHDIIKVVTTEYAVCALRNDGAVFTWGGPFGANSVGSNQHVPNDVSSNLTSGVTDIAACADGFAAVKGSNVYSWGHTSMDNTAFTNFSGLQILTGDNADVQYDLNNSSFSMINAFSALVWN